MEIARKVLQRETQDVSFTAFLSIQSNLILSKYLRVISNLTLSSSTHYGQGFDDSIIISYIKLSYLQARGINLCVIKCR